MHAVNKLLLQARQLIHYLTKSTSSYKIILCCSSQAFLPKPHFPQTQLVSPIVVPTREASSLLCVRGATPARHLGALARDCSASAASPRPNGTSTQPLPPSAHLRSAEPGRRAGPGVPISSVSSAGGPQHALPTVSEPPRSGPCPPPLCEGPRALPSHKAAGSG